MAVTDGFPSGNPGTTSYTRPATTTAAAAIDTLEYYNNSELELVAIDDFGQTVNPAYSVLVGIQTSGGKFDDAKLQEITTDNYPSYKFLEQDSVNRVYTTTASALVGATTIVFSTTVGLQRGDILRNASSNEIVRVASVTNTTDVVVVRSTGTLDAVAAKAVANGDKFIFMGSSVPIGEAGRSAFAAPAVEKYNYIQKIVTTVALNEGDEFTAKYGANKKLALQKYMDDMWKEQMRSVEFVTLFGQKATGTDATTSTVWYNAEGAINTALRGFTADISGALTVKNVIKEFGRTVPYGGGTKLVLCGSEVLAEFYSLFQTQIAVETIKSLDLNVDVLTINGTKFILKEHPLMNSDSGWSKYCVIVDTSSFKPVFPTGTNMKGKNFVGKTRFEYLYDQSNYASEKGDYVSYITFRNSNARANGAIKIVA
jgi:hypothetical protein